MSGPSPLLDIAGLTVEYPGPNGPVRVLDRVSITVGAGKVIGLVGESGSGKSSVGLASLGLLPANACVLDSSMTFSGTRFDMADRAAMARLRGRSISMIFQDPLSSLNPVFTIKAHLREVIRRLDPEVSGAMRLKLAREALASVGFAEPSRALGQYPHQLSGGMRQRVVIAMALLAKARLVIADEPTTALDAEVEKQVMAELITLKERIGCSIVLISHSLGLISRMCDEIHVMLAGRIVEHGSARAVMRAPRHEYTRALLACEVDLRTPRPKDSRSYRFPFITRTDTSGTGPADQSRR